MPEGVPQSRRLPSRLVEMQPTIGLGADGMFLATCPCLPLTKKPSLMLHARGCAPIAAAACPPVLWRGNPPSAWAPMACP